MNRDLAVKLDKSTKTKLSGLKKMSHREYVYSSSTSNNNITYKLKEIRLRQQSG